MRRILFVVLAGLLLLPASASALTVTKAELKGGQLVLEGTEAAPGIFVTVESTTAAAGTGATDAETFTITVS